MADVVDRNKESLNAIFEQALAADTTARNGWQVIEGRPWVWQHDGVRISKGGEWSALKWKGWADFKSPALRQFVIEVTVSGQAEAAGLSFGPYKDFLARLDTSNGPRHLQLEIDADVGCWAFRVDGQLMHRSWWDTKVRSVEDLLNGTLTLKAKNAETVVFQNLTLRPLLAVCRLSVIMTCFRFAQRLRLALRNWCHQDLPSSAFEVLIVNPESPDGTHELVAAVARGFPHIRVREIAVGADLNTNKGAMLNRAFEASRGEWIWLTDADCLFAPGAAATVLQQVQGREQHLFYGQRRRLSAVHVDALLAGRVDGLLDFGELATEPNLRVENGPWGFTQIVHRRVFEQIRYSEGVNHFARTDDIFVDDCRRHQISPKQLQGLFCLHIEHPFAWYGTQYFL
jgi:glycosyl transferase family 2